MSFRRRTASKPGLQGQLNNRGWRQDAHGPPPRFELGLVPFLCSQPSLMSAFSRAISSKSLEHADKTSLLPTFPKVPAGTGAGEGHPSFFRPSEVVPCSWAVQRFPSILTLELVLKVGSLSVDNGIKRNRGPSENMLFSWVQIEK